MIHPVQTRHDKNGDIREHLHSVLLLSSLVTLLVMGVFAGVGSHRAAAQNSCNTGQRYFHDIAVDADGFERFDKPVEVRLNFTPLLSEQDGSGAFNQDSVCVDEMQDDVVVDSSVVFQFDRAADYHAANKARGVLTFLMSGTMPANATRHYRVYFDTADGFTAPAFADRVTLTDNVSHKGYQSIRIVTDGAEYFYHKPGGGFATLYDADGNDWIGWNAADGAAGDFRGIPNMVHPNDGGFFHPGRKNSTTTVLTDGPLKATFRSISTGGAWEVIWDIFPGYARMTLAKKGTTNYWWLYEGTPGGMLEPTKDRLTRSNGDSIPASGSWTTDIPGDEWVFVSDSDVGRSLYLIHHQEDNQVDGYASDNSGKMTIFGFGRNGNKRLLSEQPQEFTFGLINETEINNVRPVVNAAYKPLVLVGENDGGGDPGQNCDALPYSVYLSPKKKGTVGTGEDKVTFADEDVIKYDGATCTWSMVFDGSAAGLPAAAKIDGLAVVDDDLYLSFAAVHNIPGIPGKTDDSDIVKYSNGVFTLYFDGSLYGLTTNAEDVDAIAFDADGKLLISTTGVYTVPGLPKGQDEDLLKFDNGTWSVYFDGSHNANLSKEDIVGASVAPNGAIHLSVIDAFSVPGLKGNGLDIFTCTPVSLGYLTTSCTYEPLWNATAYGMTAFSTFSIVYE